MTEIIDLLRILSETHGPPGREEEIRRVITNNVKNIVDSVNIDPLGNVIALKRGGELKVMIAAHMDEVALITSFIEDNGFIRFSPIGGIDPRILLSKRVLIHTKNKKLNGVIGVKPRHLLTEEELKKVPQINQMYIDIGVSSKSEVEELGVRVGDPITFNETFMQLTQFRVMGKALDDRAGVAVIIKVLEMFKDVQLPYTLYAVFTTQEEVGLRGATSVTYTVNPDIALVVETTTAADTPENSPSEYVTMLGKGPAIRVMDATMITQQKILDFMINIANRINVPYQLQVAPKSGTDAGTIHISHGGIPTGVISIPARYLHTPSSIIDLTDFEHTVTLTTEILKQIKNKEEFYFSI
ncbi:MAG: M42 family metallopeptidase [Thermoprotei archaeon]